MQDYEVDQVQRSPNSRRNAIIVAIVLVLVAVAAWALTRGGGTQQAGPGGGAPGAGRGRGGAGGGSRRPSATVGVAKVVAGDVDETVTAIGTVQPIVVATVRPQLSGNIFTINFTEGQVVRKGQLLAQIDPRPYRLALSQAEANLARDQATLNLARTDLQRYQTLLSQDSIARQQVQTQAATAKQAEGTVGADRALVGTARLNLQYTSITAPVSGRAGLRQADIGNYVTPGDTTGIVVITQTAPIDVAFALPQADLQKLLARSQSGTALPVTARDQGGVNELAQGRFLTFDNQIDATTGTVKAKARFPNPDGKLFPSQFVNVSLLANTLTGVATVPVTAVRHGAQGDFVFVLQADKTVKLTPVTVGPAQGGGDGDPEGRHDRPDRDHRGRRQSRRRIEGRAARRQAAPPADAAGLLRAPRRWRQQRRAGGHGQRGRRCARPRQWLGRRGGWPAPPPSSAGRGSGPVRPERIARRGDGDSRGGAEARRCSARGNAPFLRSLENKGRWRGQAEHLRASAPPRDNPLILSARDATKGRTQ